MGLFMSFCVSSILYIYIYRPFLQMLQILVDFEDSHPSVIAAPGPLVWVLQNHEEKVNVGAQFLKAS